MFSFKHSKRSILFAVPDFCQTMDNLSLPVPSKQIPVFTSPLKTQGVSMHERVPNRPILVIYYLHLLYLPSYIICIQPYISPSHRPYRQKLSNNSDITIITTCFSLCSLFLGLSLCNLPRLWKKAARTKNVVTPKRGFSTSRPLTCRKKLEWFDFELKSDLSKIKPTEERLTFAYNIH